MDIRQWSQDSSAFKTITSGSETRHQTSNKKQYTKPKSSHGKSVHYNVDHSMGLEDMHQLLNHLIAKRQKLSERKKYQNAIDIDRRINHVKQKIMEKQQQVIGNQHYNQQLQVYEMHENEMMRFRQKWEQIFSQFQRKQHIMKVKLQTEEQRQARQVSQCFQKKVQKLDQSIFKSKQLMNLERMETDLSRRGQYQELVKLNIKDKRKRLKKQLLAQRNQTIQKMYQVEQHKLRSKYNKKYSSLASKLQQCKNYELKIYKKNQHMLKQKFLNSVSKLEHDQTMRKSRCFSAIK